MNYEQIKINLANMSALSPTATPKAALERIEQLEAALHRIASHLDIEQSVLDNMSAQERDCQIRMHKLAIESLF